MQKVAFLVVVIVVGSVLSFAEEHSEDYTEILELLRTFEKGIELSDATILESVFVNKHAAMYGVRDGLVDTSFDPERHVSGGFVKYITTSGFRMREVLKNPRIQIQDGIAFVSCTYEFYRGDIMSNYGLDYFSLVKTTEGWKIASAVWTVTVTPEMLEILEKHDESQASDSSSTSCKRR